jgi:hypothetical protein
MKELLFLYSLLSCLQRTTALWRRNGLPCSPSFCPPEDRGRDSPSMYMGGISQLKEEPKEWKGATWAMPHLEEGSSLRLGRDTCTSIAVPIAYNMEGKKKKRVSIVIRSCPGRKLIICNESLTCLK